MTLDSIDIMQSTKSAGALHNTPYTRLAAIPLARSR